VAILRRRRLQIDHVAARPPHRTLRSSPAMAADVTDRLWSIEKI